VGSLLDILTQESNAGRSRGVPEPKGRSSAYKHPLLFNVDEEATRKRTGGYGDQSNDLDARNGVEASGDEVDGSRAAATWAEKSRGMCRGPKCECADAHTGTSARSAR
jgi:hypothetical protein